MSNNVVSKTVITSTGPRTREGKVASSKNATKSGIFSKGYLAWEDQAEKQAQWEALVEEWEVSTPTGLNFLRDIEQANLAQERLMYAERKVVEGAMLSTDISLEFAKRSGIGAILAMELPAWFFLDDDAGNKEDAIYFAQVYDQANALKQKYSDQLVASAQNHYPQLYEYVMKGCAQNDSFVMALSKQYQKNLPTLNLTEIMNQLASNFRSHLLWAEQPARFQMIIDGLRAEKMLAVLDFDKSNRYLTSFQNRRMRALQGLEALERRCEAKYLSKKIASDSILIQSDEKAGVPD